jgi:hypothetical protein
MQEAIIWLVTYKGQTESPYKWAGNSFQEAQQVMERLERMFPDREWSIEEKDVS